MKSFWLAPHFQTKHSFHYKCIYVQAVIELCFTNLVLSIRPYYLNRHLELRNVVEAEKFQSRQIFSYHISERYPYFLLFKWSVMLSIGVEPYWSACLARNFYISVIGDRYIFLCHFLFQRHTSRQYAGIVLDCCCQLVIFH